MHSNQAVPPLLECHASRARGRRRPCRPSEAGGVGLTAEGSAFEDPDGPSYEVAAVDPRHH